MHRVIQGCIFLSLEHVKGQLLVLAEGTVLCVSHTVKSFIFVSLLFSRMQHQNVIFKGTKTSTLMHYPLNFHGKCEIYLVTCIPNRPISLTFKAVKIWDFIVAFNSLSLASHSGHCRNYC
jgi:hypothetical protein